jgi:hypothetical protein
MILFSDDKDPDPDFPVFYLCKKCGAIITEEIG